MNENLPKFPTKIKKLHAHSFTTHYLGSSNQALIHIATFKTFEDHSNVNFKP